MENKYAGSRRDSSASLATLGVLAVLGAGILLYSTFKGIQDNSGCDRAIVSSSVERSYIGSLEDSMAEFGFK